MACSVELGLTDCCTILFFCVWLKFSFLTFVWESGPWLILFLECKWNCQGGGYLFHCTRESPHWPCFEQKVGLMISWSPLQPELSCDRMSWTETTNRFYFFLVVFVDYSIVTETSVSFCCSQFGKVSDKPPIISSWYIQLFIFGQLFGEKRVKLGIFALKKW